MDCVVVCLRQGQVSRPFVVGCLAFNTLLTSPSAFVRLPNTGHGRPELHTFHLMLGCKCFTLTDILHIAVC